MLLVLTISLLLAIGYLPNRFYTCTAENTELKDYKFGSQFSLEITTNRRRSCEWLIFSLFLFRFA
ncbi:hypothetical protein ANCCAN_26622 [Ancylostoma caninum]|uniref:Uncharacterized protein n=1 Tax=Ancylostoma caninum TaxID=29170 RepID=A0A368F6D7_ANCCA|nr:hypothetical protein ANCCAN_26622 [Ancylostoma caninum]